MITDAIQQTNTWQQQLQELITDVAELAELLDIAPSAICPKADAAFGLRLPRAMLGKIEKGNVNDPILRQFLPAAREMVPTPGFGLDPLAESESNPVPGLVHKYRGRVLIMAAGHCAVNCRYCFRRHFSYEDNRLSGPNLQRVLQYIADDPSINEVILSGGDPLAVSNRQLTNWIEQLEAIEHLSRLRIHSRLPVVIPERIDSPLLALLASSRLQTVMVIHSNHPNELDTHLAQHMARLREVGVHLLNQTVLLKGVNDCADTLMRLSEDLFKMGVMPYYLHLLDPVQGAADFDVSEKRAKELHQTLMAGLPGYLVPRLVREIAHRPSKTWVNA